jgi:signal transduction histidine kinase
MATNQIRGPVKVAPATSAQRFQPFLSPATAPDREETRGILAALLRMPLFYKLIIANGAIVFVAVVVCASLTASAVRSDPNASALAVILPVVVVAFLSGTATNAILVHLALTPLRKLSAAAERITAGGDDARAEESAFDDAAARQMVRTFNQMLDTVGAYRRRLREIAIRAIDAGEAERLRISSELHDGIAQSLAAILIHLRIARTAASPETQASLAEASEQLSSAIGGLRTLAQGLRPPALDMIGLSAAIMAHMRNVSETTGLHIDARVEGVDGALAAEAELALYRLIQEALLNVVRHAHTSQARVSVIRERSAVVAIVSDAGVGFDVNGASADGALGLFGMYERASYVGGSVAVMSTEGSGTTVRIEMPFKEAHVV